jgi:hypothetical protein
MTTGHCPSVGHPDMEMPTPFRRAMAAAAGPSPTRRDGAEHGESQSKAAVSAPGMPAALNPLKRAVPTSARLPPMRDAAASSDLEAAAAYDFRSVCNMQSAGSMQL